MGRLDDGATGEVAQGIRQARAAVRGGIEERVARHGAQLRATAKTRKSAATHERIMAAAYRLMNEYGGSSFQMSEVSALCGMSKGSLYYYFADKAALVEAVYARTVDELVEGIESLVRDAPSAIDSIRGVSGALAREIKANGPLAMAMSRELVSGGMASGVFPKVETHLARIVAIVTEQLDRGKEEGVVRADVDSRLAASSVCGAFVFAAIELGSRGAGDVDRLAADLFALALRGFGAPGTGG